MNITENLIRISKAKDDIKQSLRDKGIAVPDDALLDEYSSIIDETELYGPTYKNLYDMRTNNGTNMRGLYSYCVIPELDLSNLDTSKATDMSYMFNQCFSSVNIDGWDTSKVTNMERMFFYFSGSIDISKLDTSSVTNVGYMFSSANTDNIILTGLSFPSATSLDYMFSNAKGTTLDLSSWDISNITNMSNMFSADYKKINLTGWKTTNVTSMDYIFSTYNNPLEELIIPDWDMTNVTSSSSFMNPSYMSKLRLIDLSRSNDTTIAKIASYLPTRTITTFGDVMVPSNTSQATYDALIAKYWRPIGADLSPVPTSVEIVAELDELIPGKPRTTRVYVGNCDPWYADTSKVEIVMTSSESIATIEGDTITSTGVLGDIVLEARVIDTQEVIGTKTIPVTETDSYPNVVKFRLNSTPPSYAGVITVNGMGRNISELTYDSVFDIYSYDAGVPITSINFSSYLGELVKLNTSNVTDMKQMFYSCNELRTLALGNWNTSNVTTMQEMFYNCESLASLDLSNFNTSNVTDMDYMFYNCRSLYTLDLSGWDTSNMTTMSNMFTSCKSLTSLDLSNFDTNKVTDINNMFNGCSKLHTLHLDNCNNDTINKIITSYAFPTNLIDGIKGTIYCKKENAAGLTPPTNWVFEYIDAVPETPDNTIVVYTVNDANKTAPYSVGNKAADWKETVIHNEDGTHTVFVTGSELPEMLTFRGNTALVSVSYINTSNITSMREMFDSCTRVTSLDLSNFDTSKVTNMNNMFTNCFALESLDISNFNTSNVTDMSYMFRECTALHTLRLDNCSNDTINKIITSYKFPTGAIEGVTRTIYCKEENAAGLTPPTNWVFSYITEEEPEVPVDPPVEDILLYVPGEFQENTEITEVRTMVDESHDDLNCMFYGCTNLISVNTEDWDTSNVTDMSSMFQECTSLTQLDLSNFNTALVWSMGTMFYGCTSLTTLDLSNWDTTSIFSPDWDMKDMFLRCKSLHTLRLDNCSNDTISKIITLDSFPTNAIEGVTRTIYCKEANAAGLTAPTNWVFSYVD